MAQPIRLQHLHKYTSCWRALARQLPILYNSEKKAKSVGCKIEDMRSRLYFFISGHSGVLVNARGNIDRFSSNDKWRSLIGCGSIHEGHEWFNDDSRGRQEMFMCLAALLWEQFCRFANEGAKISIKSYFMRSFFSQCIQQQWSVSQNYLLLLPFGVNCRLQLAGLGGKREETVKPTCFMSKATSVPQTPQTNRSQCSSPVEALNLIVESKSQPVELDNSAIELHVPSRRKKSSVAIILISLF